jgi:hypothetical protein
MLTSKKRKGPNTAMGKIPRKRKTSTPAEMPASAAKMARIVTAAVLVFVMR